MKISRGIAYLFNKANAVEWKLLGFMVMFMNVKLAVKISALILIFLLQPNLRIGLRLKNPRLPLFYVIMPAIVIIDFLVWRNYSGNYAIVALTALAFWLSCLLAAHQNKLFAEKTDITRLHNTLLLFFMLNCAASFINLAAIFFDIGIRNPFLYQGQYQKYFLNTGDYIKGISFDTSTTNAFINCAGVIYFLGRKKYLPLFACMMVLLLTASNLSNIFLVLVFAGLFIFGSIKEQKSIMIVCTLLIVIFLAKISPQNESYLADSLAKFVLHNQHTNAVTEKIIPIRERPDSLLTDETRKEKFALLFLDSLARVMRSANHLSAASEMKNTKPEIPQDSIHTAAFQWKRDTTAFQRQLMAYVLAKSPYALLSYEQQRKEAGKIMALKQSFNFFKQHPHKLITGDGAGNFSSKLAFRATGLNIAGGYPQQLSRSSPEFLQNHLSLYLFFLLKHADAHSIIHSPASAYDQIFTEYGLLGLLAFILYYAGFFMRHIKKLTHGIPLLALLFIFLSVDYWFEQLSIVVFTELILFINLKEQALKKVYG